MRSTHLCHARTAACLASYSVMQSYSRNPRSAFRQYGRRPVLLSSSSEPDSDFASEFCATLGMLLPDASLTALRRTPCNCPGLHCYTPPGRTRQRYGTTRPPLARLYFGPAIGGILSHWGHMFHFFRCCLCFAMPFCLLHVPGLLPRHPVGSQPRGASHQLIHLLHQLASVWLRFISVYVALNHATSFAL